MMPSAPDLESLSEWRCIVFRTSSAVIVWPLWNSTPLRILKVQVLASGVLSQLSASEGISSPSGETDVSMLPRVDMYMNGTWLASSAGSSELVLSPPPRPMVSVPPFFGPAARAAPASSVLAIAADTPRAAARPRKARRLWWPAAARAAK